MQLKKRDKLQRGPGAVVDETVFGGSKPLRHPPRLILCVDQAAVSGWCIVAPHVVPVVSPLAFELARLCVLDCGIASTFTARRTVFVQLGEHMRSLGLTPSDVYVVLEEHSHVAPFATRGKGKRTSTPKTFIGMGKAWGRWEEQAMFAGLPLSHVHSVPPQTWRAALLGSSRGGDEARKGAKELAEGVLGRELAEDAAEAVCIGLWAASNLERVLRGEPAPAKPRKKRSRKAAA